jgi:hypothetical protein
VAIGVNGLSQVSVSLLKLIGSHINCIGKRGSFWQYIGETFHKGDLSLGYTCPQENEQLADSSFQWVQHLDDFGDALCKAKDGFNRISTYGEGKIELGKHRVLVRTRLPYKFKQSSRYFTQYEKPE